MGIIDWCLVLAYAVLVISIGAVAQKKQKGTDEYFRGSRKLPWWAIGISIVATAFSAASILGAPGEGYGYGFLWMQLQLGDLLGYLLVIFILLPIYVKLDITTAYEYLEKRFDSKTRSLGAVCFLLFVIARLGALLFGAALVFSKVAGIPMAMAIVAVGGISILYTVAGGMAAVIWTDVLQFITVIAGVVVAIFVVASGVPGGMSEVMKIAGDAGKLQIVDMSWNPSSIRSFPTAFLAYGILAFAVAGTNQQSVQRYVSCTDVRSAQKASILAWFAGAVGVGACLLLGVFLFSFYQVHPGALPEGLKGDNILPHFIATQMPVGAAGLMVAAIFAAAMSSIDSALHSLSTSLTVDFYRRHFSTKASEKHYMRVAQGFIIFWGLAGIGAAFYVAATGAALLPFLIKYTALFLGPVLGLFLLGVFIPRANANGAFWGALGAAACLYWLGNYSPIQIPGIWNSAMAAPLTVVLGLLISLFGKRPAKESLKGLIVKS